MSDVKDILGLGGAAPAASPIARPRAAAGPATKSKPKEGRVKRELLSLANNWAGRPLPTLAPTAKPVFKQLRSKPSSWVWERIRSSARLDATNKEDDLEISHWVKFKNAPDYRFAKFNRKIRLMEYTNEEYAERLQDPKWTREETDRLFRLCKLYDLRFLVIHDRFLAEEKELEERLYGSSSRQGLAPGASADPFPVPLPPAQLQPSAESESATAETPASSSSVAPSQDTRPAQMDMDADPAPAPAAPAPSAAPPAEPSTSDTNGMPSLERATSATPMALDGTGPAPSPSPSPLPGAGLAPAAVSAPPTPPPSTALVSPYTGRRYKTVEDLKARFYYIQQALLEKRNSSDPDLRQHALFKQVYDRNYETERKTQLERLFRRTKEQEAEMAACTLELRRLSAAIQRVKKQNAEAARLARLNEAKNPPAPSAVPAPAVPSTPVAPGTPAVAGTAPAAAMATPSTPKVAGRPPVKKTVSRRGLTVDAEAAAAGDMPIGAGGSTPLPDAPLSPSALALSSDGDGGAGIGGPLSEHQQPIPGHAPVPESCIARSIHRERAGGCYLRSAHVTAPLNVSARVAKQLENDLLTMGYKKNRPFNVPTAAVSEAFDKLRSDMVTLYNLQRVIEKREADLKNKAAGAATPSNKGKAKGGAGGGKTSAKKHPAPTPTGGDRAKRQKVPGTPS